MRVHVDQYGEIHIHTNPALMLFEEILSRIFIVNKVTMEFMDYCKNDPLCGLTNILVMKT